jgi:hypothetical protein
MDGYERFEDELPGPESLTHYAVYGDPWFEIERDGYGNITGSHRIIRGHVPLRDRLLLPMTVPGAKHIPPVSINSPMMRKRDGCWL